MRRAETSARAARAALARAPRDRWQLPPQAESALEPAQRERLLELVRAVLERPTAPYAEDRQLALLREFTAARPGLRIRFDAHANALIEWPGRAPRARSAARLAFSAHLDHPGLHYLGRRKGEHRARLHGGAPFACLPGARVRFFDPREGPACASARIASARRDAAGRVELALDEWRGRARRGDFGTWDFAAGALRGTRLRARVCDDLMGAAAILAVLDELWRARAPHGLIGVFTRAEETGFVGCQGLLRSRALPRNTQVIGLECSPRRASARVGAGPVLRVGDARSVFDPELCAWLHRLAKRLEARPAGFRFQRALMDGGSCESTAYNLWGVRAGGLCLALGNYHNRGPRGRMAPEFVDWRDFEGLFEWLRAAARDFRNDGPGAAQGRDSLDRVWTAEFPALAASTRRLQAALHAP